MTHEGSHREVYREFQPSYDIFRRWCQRLFRPQVPCTPAYTDTEPTTSIGWLIKSSQLLRVSSNTQAILEQSPIQVVTELNAVWLQWSYENSISKLISRWALWTWFIVLLLVHCHCLVPMMCGKSNTNKAFQFLFPNNQLNLIKILDEKEEFWN